MFNLPMVSDKHLHMKIAEHGEKSTENEGGATRGEWANEVDRGLEALRISGVRLHKIDISLRVGVFDE